MRSALFAVVIALAACASGALDESESAADAQNEDDGKSKSKGKTIESDEDSTEPPPQSDSKKKDAAPPTEEEEEEDSGTSPPPPKAPTTQTANCTSQTGGHKSVSTLKYTETNGTIDIVSMTTVVTNSQGGNLNDLTMYVKGNGASTYSAVYSSGDILTSGKTVSLSLPSNISISTGDTLRIDTYFDEAWVPDPVASCSVSF